MATNQVGTCDHEAALLLPWYVNGTLTQEERRAVEDHLVTCHICPDELVGLVKVQALLDRELTEAPERSAALWPKVRGSIRELQASSQGVARQHVRTAWAWLSGLLRPALRPAWALAALVLMVIQAAVIVGLVARGPLQVGPEYRTLTGQTTLGQLSGQRVRLRVAFVEQAPEQAIRATLAEIRATIVDGPSAAGFYLIDVPLDGGAVKSPEEARRALRARPEVVRFAELAAQ